MSVRLSLSWTYLAQSLNFLIAFASSVVVARLVSPRDFGIFAMAVAITTILNILMQLGLAKYIMREPVVDRALLRSLFTVNAALTAFYVVAILVGAAVASNVAKSDEVGQFLTVFALYPFIGMFEFVPSALCARNMRFGVIATASVLRAVVMAATTVGLAMMGFAYMSFAWAAVAAALVTSLFYNIVCWRPDVWKPRLVGFRSILTFGAEMVGIGGFSQLSARAGEMVLGSALGLASLGLYARSSSLPAQLYANIYGAGSNVIFSRLSQDLRDTGAFHDTYIRFMRLMLALLWPMMAGLAVLAQPIVLWLYGDRWQAAATPLAILTLAFAVTIAIGMASEVFVLRHETRRQLKIEAVRSSAGLALFIGGAMISLTAAAAAKLVEAIVAFVMYQRPMNRLVGAAPGRLNAVYKEGVMLAFAAALPSLALMISTRWSPSTSVPAILLAIISGITLWATIVVRTRHPLAAEVARMLHHVRTRIVPTSRNETG